MGQSKRRANFKAKIDTRFVNKQSNKPGLSKAQPFKVNMKGKNVNNANRKLDPEAGTGHFRTNSTIRRLDMQNHKMTAKEKKARVKEPHEMRRIEENRKWFQNTRTIDQTALDKFRNVFETAKEDPFAMVIQRSKTPMALFDPDAKVLQKQSSLKKLTSFQAFPSTFHSKGKKEKTFDGLGANFDSIAVSAAEMRKDYDVTKDTDKQKSHHHAKARNVGRTNVEDDTYAPLELCMTKGTSKRIWAELYKVIDSSDIICYVIDARDPMGTRCRALEQHIKKDKPNKHQMIVLNKVDLVPNYITKKWIHLLSKEFPTVGYCTSLSKGFGRQTFINLIRQYSKMLKEHRNIAIGFVGYPNAGKSSLINSLRNKLVCKVAPVPGETKVWQYISLTNRIHLIDCPGVVPSDPNDEYDLVLKGVIRAEKLDDPEVYISAIMDKISDDTFRKRYKIPKSSTWRSGDAMDFLEVLGKRLGKLKKGGEVEFHVTARRVIHDYQRGRLPYFIKPPSLAKEDNYQASDEEMGSDAEQGFVNGQVKELNEEED